MTQARWTDQEVRRAAQDHLSFAHYCQILAEIVNEADTPLTIGIFGPWGSGKTSLLRLVEEKLQATAPQPDRRPPLTVWFNAWKYDQEEALWRALVIQVLNAFRLEPDQEASFDEIIQSDLPPGEAVLAADPKQLTQRLDDLEASLYRTVEREEVGGVTIDWDKLLKGSIMGITHLSISALPGIGSVLGKMMEKAQEKITGEDINTIFEAIQRERRKIYREHIRSLEQFQRKFEELVDDEAVKKNRRLVVFIDDLDRCLPEKAIEVLEALKLFLDVPGCVFFLAADREVIQRGIRVKYKDFLIDSDDPVAASRRIPITGDNYLEKIVQLPFHLLPLDEERVEQFITATGVELPAGCADIFAAGLEANPRKVKRALNIFRLTHKLAAIRQAEFKVEGQQVQIKPQLLAKVVVIQNRYSQLYNDLVEYPALLQDLEQYFTQEPDARGPAAEPGGGVVKAGSSGVQKQEPVVSTGQTLLQKYQHLRPLRRLLTRGDRFSGLPLAEVKLYLYLTYTTDESSTASAADNLVARWWAELLSNDLTKIKSAVAAIQEEGDQAVLDFQRRLIAAIEQPGGEYPLRQRFSIGTALALLDDPRDLDEMVAVPAGEYPLGPESRPKHLEGFKIGKYPVTNAQYKKFLDQNPDYPAPGHWDQANRNYPPELANHPVTEVSWHDAQAYCRWAGKRLPSAEEWEAAARGPEGRLYPYGAESLPQVGNTAEERFNSTSPVGIFPGGASPFGCQDMSGNIWEWTSTSGQEGQALKGGAWNAPTGRLESFSSWWNSPDSKTEAIGFRVAE